MNVTELRDALDDLAGPPVAPTAAQRQSVRKRVRRARLVRGSSALVLAFAVAIGVGAIVTLSGGTDPDRPTPVRTDRSRVIHDEKVGYTVTIPPGWYLDVLQPDGTVVAGVKLRQYDAEREARRTRQAFQDLLPIQSERSRLVQEMSALPAASPERATIQRRLNDLNDAEAEIRARTNDLGPIQWSRSQLQEQLNDPSLSEPDRAALMSQIDALNDAEVRIRSRPRSGCVSPAQTGIHIAVLESTGPAPRRPARFGPRSGTGLESKRTSPSCKQLIQSMRFTDAGRTFALSVTMPTATGPRRRAETYAILNDLRFDRR